jgi:hypothetical protein
MFRDQKHRFFDTVSEFAQDLEQTNILEQIEWIENGSYGAGACFALQLAFASLTKRTNNRARIGSVVLHALYGAPFTAWHKLPTNVQDSLNTAIDSWLESDKSFAMAWEI